MSFDAGSIVGHVDLKTGDFIINSKKITSSNESMTKSMFKSQLAFAAVEKAIGGVTNFLKDAINTSSSFEQYQVSFETMLGSAERATEFLRGMQDFAAATPFKLDQLAQASQTMLSFGMSAEQVMKNLKTLGDVSQGNAEKFKGITLAFSQIQSTGRLMGQDLLQLINQGFNPLTIISQKTGKSMAKLKKEMENGAISADMVSEAFQIATSEGGLFFNAMEKQSKTFAGRMSTLEDSIGMVKKGIGDALLPVVKDLVELAIPFTEWLRTIDKSTIQMALGFVGAGIAIFGAVKAFNAMKAAFVGGISPLQGVLMALAAIAAVVTVVNQALIEARTIHQKLAEQYGKEYEAIDGQVKRYEELKNAQTLTGAQKAELANIEDQLQKQLGETSVFLDEQSGRWTVNANAVQKYKKERIDLMVRELKAQEIVAKADVQWAKEREAWFARGEAEMKRFGARSTETTLQWIRYGLDIIDINKARLFSIQEVTKSQDDLAKTQGQLNALQNNGYKGWKQYKQEQDGASESTKGMTDNVGKLNDKLEDQEEKLKRLRELRQDLLGETLDGQQKELYELERKKDAYEAEYGKQEFIAEWYNKRVAEINKKYAIEAKQAWIDSISDITSAIQDIVSPVQQAWSAIQGVWTQALANEEASMQYEYDMQRQRIENSVMDEKAKIAKMEELDKQYAEKKAELQKKQWIAQQAANIVGAVMNTAQAVTSALMVFPPWLGIALAVAVGALGAAQIALIASQQMPAFGKGGKASKGLALVGEYGPEVVKFDRPATVYSTKESAAMLGSSGMGNGDVSVNFYGNMYSNTDVDRVAALMSTRLQSVMRGAA